MEGKGKGKGGSDTESALDPHPSPMQLNKPLHKGKARPCTALTPCRGGIELPEFLKEFWNIPLTDSDARIGHADFDSVIIRYGANLDKAFCGKLGRIADEVQYHLTDPHLIGLDHLQTLSDLHLELYFLVLDQGLGGGHDALDDLFKIDRF